MTHILTVIIRNRAPFDCMQEPPEHRSVHIELTSEQMAQIALDYTHTIGKAVFYEEISHCFIEKVEEGV